MVYLHFFTYADSCVMLFCTPVVLTAFLEQLLLCFCGLQPYDAISLLRENYVFLVLKFTFTLLIHLLSAISRLWSLVECWKSKKPLEIMILHLLPALLVQIAISFTQSAWTLPPLYSIWMTPHTGILFLFTCIFPLDQYISCLFRLVIST